MIKQVNKLDHILEDVKRYGEKYKARSENREHVCVCVSVFTHSQVKRMVREGYTETETDANKKAHLASRKPVSRGVRQVPCEMP